MAVDHDDMISGELAARLDAERIAIEQAMREAACEAVRRHQHAGQPLVVWQDGKVVLLPADEARRLH